MKAVLPNVWRSLGDSKDGLFLVENEAFYPFRAKVWPDFHFLLERAHFGLSRSLVAVRSKQVTQQQLDLTSVAQSLVQSRVSADAPRAMLIRAIVRACDDARTLLRSRRTDALVAELELLRRYSIS
jgi:hypothetical protein